MYGYVRPVKGELKVAELERFQGVYCGLCHALARRYGFFSRFLVNYDFTFLAMLLAKPGEGSTCPRRCAAHPLRKTLCLDCCPSLSKAADLSVIMGWWKLADGAADSGGLLRVGYKLACAALRRAYKNAASAQPDFAHAVEEQLAALRALEETNCPSVDETADKFALILRAVAADEQGTRGRVLGELLYHLGRIVYILDAADDLAGDTAAGRYNPLRFRFDTIDGRLSEEDEQTLRTGLQLSRNALAGAYELLDSSEYAGILSNTIYLGLPAAAQAVFAGTWNAGGRSYRKRS